MNMPEPNQNTTIYLPLTMSNNTSSSSPPGDKSPAIFIDLKRCIGCNACSLACKQENNVQIGERWNEVYGSENGAGTARDIRTLPMLCHHCADAPCKNKCDELGYHAIQRRADGIVYVDASKCVGCQKCIPKCHYKAMFFNTQTKKAEKCHFCMHRIDAGLAPACVITCLGVTREFGSYSSLKALHPNAEEMGERVKILYGNLGEEPKYAHGDTPTNGYPSPIECHD
jgi:tetrathionate reductase subunit B